MIHRAAAALAAVFLSGWVGCSDRQSSMLSNVGTVTASVTGALIESSTPGTYDAIDLTQIDPDGIPLANRKRITTNEYLVLHLEVEDGPFGDAEFDVLFGPHPQRLESGQGNIDTTTGQFMLTSGWALIRGEMPCAQTPRTVAAADGTTLLFWIDKAGGTPIDLIYLLHQGASSVTRVEQVSGGGAASLALAGSFARNDGAAGNVTTGTVASGDDHDDFIQLIRPLATQVGLWP